MCGEITYPIPCLNVEAVQVWEWICNSISHHTRVYDYLSSLELNLIHVCKMGPAEKMSTACVITVRVAKWWKIQIDNVMYENFHPNQISNDYVVI